MRALVQHASRSVIANAALTTPSQASRSFVRTAARSASTPSICVQCRYRTSITGLWSIKEPLRSKPSNLLRRRFYQTSNDEKRPLDEHERAAAPSEDPKPPPDVIELPSDSSAEPTIPDVKPAPEKDVKVASIPSVPAEDLPSHREAQRWDFSKRLTELMDDLLPKLAVVTQRVNSLTGTDYSGIEALKREIKEHENLVKARRVAIEDAKQALDVAMHQQASSQKEVVALLERKHSWSATDLERYMSLIRSEHVNDQAVREAKEAIAAAENALEDARAQLERRERAQYHEEQIWSDTIRRNSTWVTFGLMGLNIFLLLTSLVIFEPWRRRRMVREVKNALEAHKAALEPTVAALPPALALETSTPAPSSEPQVPAPTAVAETEVDRALEAGEAVEVKESATTTTLPTTSPQSLKETDPAMEQSAQVPEAIPAASPDTIPNSEALGAALLTPDGVVPQEAINIDEEVKVATDEVPQTWQEKVTYIAHDAISDRAISMRRVDFTTAILQSATAGAVIAAAAIALCVRPR